MVGIIVEGVLFVALLATIAALLFHVVTRYTPLGLRLQQTRNRRQLESATDSRAAEGGGDGAPAIRRAHLSGLL
jgi:hypothetical protein